MKIGIQTLQLNTNYGGILQAYALQTVLQRMGHDASVITKFSIFAFPLWMYPLALGFRLVKKYILGQKNIVIFNVKKRKEEAVIVRQHTQRFIDTYINKLECERFISLPENCVDAIVVGSDQVWRPRYFGKKIIADAYLEFARGWDIKRLSYAASFGTAEWEYSESQTAKCKELIAKFDAVSVREESAVGLCKDHFGVEAQHLLDPTMLLSKEDYIASVEKSRGKEAVSVSFRDKTNVGWSAHIESLTFDDGVYYSHSFRYLFFEHVMCRHSCGVCYFANTTRPSDVTIADFWGWQKVDPKFNKDDKGCSLLFCNSAKGVEWFETVKGELDIMETPLESCMQPNLKQPSSVSPKRMQFEDDYHERGFEYVQKRYGNVGWGYQLRERCKYISRLPMRVKRLMKRVIKR
ncbi:MAG: polysaccharide pyruvyl transferase family protein [Rikenellaceae bacterium]